MRKRKKRGENSCTYILELDGGLKWQLEFEQACFQHKTFYHLQRLDMLQVVADSANV